LRQRKGLKNPWARQEDVFLVHPQNGLNGLILNWCIGGCCFTPAVEDKTLTTREVLIDDDHLCFVEGPATKDGEEVMQYCAP